VAKAQQAQTKAATAKNTAAQPIVFRDDKNSRKLSQKAQPETT